LNKKINQDDLSSQKISSNVAQLKLSAIKEMAMLSSKIENVASLTWGVPSFRTPECIRENVKKKLDQDMDIGKYVLPDGLKELRQLVVNKHFKETGIEVDADKNVMITSGNMQGMNTIFHTIIDSGDEVILTDPCFASHIQQVKQFGGEPVYWQLDEKNNWALDVGKLPELINKKTKAIVIVSPSNPTGKIFTKANLMRVGEIAKQHDLLVLIDDPYSHFIYDNEENYFNLASVKNLFDNMVYLFSFSKAYAMSGWRLGYMILPEYLKTRALIVQDLAMICTPRISQVAGIAALTNDESYISDFQNILSCRRELICQRLDEMRHVFEYNKPEGAYYVFPKILIEHKSSYDFSIQLLNEAKVTVTPGSAFGPSGEGHVRMAYCVEEDIINLAFDRMQKYFGEFD